MPIPNDPNPPSPSPPIAPPRHALRGEREAYGKRLRDRARRVDQARWIDGDRDVLSRLRANEVGHRADLLPFRHARMAASPFGFLRGGAAIMAPDLAAMPSTGYLVQLCGDAHVRNLGACSGTDGKIVFDVNDFDETCRGPWEWDVKRLAISLALVVREAGDADPVAREVVHTMVRTYRTTMGELAELPACELARYAVHHVPGDDAIRRVLATAERMTARRVRDELTAPGPDGRPRFVDDRPKLARIPDDEARQVLAALEAYRATLTPSCQQVLDGYLAYDVAARLAGTGSVGARNYVVLCVGNGIDDPLILQVKQALPSCYHALGLAIPDPRVSDHEGKRVVDGQDRMQTWIDPFLGWTTAFDAPFYVRQVGDHTASLDPTALKRAAAIAYASVCGAVFAKAHARSADAAVLFGYLGDTDKLDVALAELAIAGADQVTRDWRLLVGAIKRGELMALDPA